MSTAKAPAAPSGRICKDYYFGGCMNIYDTKNDLIYTTFVQLG